MNFVMKNLQAFFLDPPLNRCTRDGWMDGWHLLLLLPLWLSAPIPFDNRCVARTASSVRLESCQMMTLWLGKNYSRSSYAIVVNMKSFFALVSCRSEDDDDFAGWWWLLWYNRRGRKQITIFFFCLMLPSSSTSVLYIIFGPFYSVRPSIVYPDLNQRKERLHHHHKWGKERFTIREWIKNTLYSLSASLIQSESQKLLLLWKILMLRQVPDRDNSRLEHPAGASDKEKENWGRNQSREQE